MSESILGDGVKEVIKGDGGPRGWRGGCEDVIDAKCLSGTFCISDFRRIIEEGPIGNPATIWMWDTEVFCSIEHVLEDGVIFILCFWYLLFERIDLN